jgi:imidazolonepropionase-like amidohydrolase
VKAARLLDVRSGRYVERPVVVVRGGSIESVGTTVPAGGAGDRPRRPTLLPGLIDAHTHVLLQGDATQAEYEQQILKEYPAHRVARAVRALKIALEHGFTTMRDLETEGAGYDDVALRDAISEGVIPRAAPPGGGPRAVDHGDLSDPPLPAGLEVPIGVDTCDGADGCRRAVREHCPTARTG